MKKSKLKKILAEEMAAYDNRLEAVESLLKVGKSETESLQFSGPSELTVLPDKWCVKHSPETFKWIQENAEHNGNCISPRSYYFFPCNSAGNNSGCDYPKGYTEITFDDFKRLVLKEGTTPEIDWSKPGQLVQYETGAIWATTGKHRDKKFTGILIRSLMGKPIGEESNGLYKTDFTLCTEPITISNE